MRLERGPGGKLRRGCASLAGLLLAVFVAAPESAAQGGGLTTRPIERMQEQAPKPPEESPGVLPIEVPPFPRAEHLVELDRSLFKDAVRVFLDPGALSQPAPGVVRYTLLLVSSQGTGNVFYESINCDSNEWRTLAYGTRTGGFEAIRQPRWRTLDAGASTGHRRALAKHYVCILGRRLPDRAEDLRRRLARPDTSSETQYGTLWNR